MPRPEPTQITPAAPTVPPTSAPTPELLTVSQAAAFLQMSESSVRSYIRQGDLKAFRVAGLRKVLIPRAELMKLLSPV